MKILSIATSNPYLLTQLRVRIFGKKESMKFSCDNCDKEFFGYRYGKHKFCSYDCNTKFKKKNVGAWNKGNRKYTYNCKNCGKKCSKSRDSKYCNQKCWTSSKEFSKMTRKNGIKNSKKGFNPYIGLTHGMSKTPTYRVWADMKNRCYNKNIKAYKWYGKRGVKVCDRWLESFENFYEDMGEKPNKLTLDRIDNDGNYEPGNCRWATRKQQSRNTRRNKS